MIEVDYAHAEAYASEYVDARPFIEKEIREDVWMGVRAGYLKALEDTRASTGTDSAG